MNKCFLLIFALLVSSIFAVCVPTQRSLYVPAVINENYSDMLKINVNTQPGVGEVYISVGPTIGTSTQDSEKIAADVAYRIADSRDCDVMLKIETPESVSKIDGPSAGAAMTLLILSALQQNTLRSDFSITGTIEEDGKVGMVGGVPLKTEAVANLGKKLFLVPDLDSTDKALVLVMQKYYDIVVFKVDTIEEAYEIVKNISMPTSNIILVNETSPSFRNAILNHKYSDYFANVAGMMIDDSEENILDISTRQPNAEGNMLSRLEIAKAAKETGNYYTAANTVFLLSIDSNVLDYSEENVLLHMENVLDCIDNFELNDVENSAVDNFELAAAANLRYLWAIKKIPTDYSAETLTMKLKEYSDTLYAENWCNAARDMSTYKHDSGEVNLTKAKEIAEELLAEAYKEDILNESTDLNWRWEIASKAYDEGMYVESIIDSNFVISSEEIGDLGNKTIKDAEKRITEIIDEKGNKSYVFLWPQLYKNHAKVFEEDDPITSARLYLFADKLEQSFSEIANASGGFAPMQNGTANDTNTSNQTNLTLPNISTDKDIERSAMGETRTVYEPKPPEGWDLRFLLYLVIMIAVGYIVQHERHKKQKEQLKEQLADNQTKSPIS